MLARRPSGLPTLDDFQILEEEVSSPGPGEVLIETLWLSLDPYQRGRMSAGPSYAASLQIGDPMPGGVVARVLESADPSLDEGDCVEGLLTWSEAHLCSAEKLRRLDPAIAPLSAALGILGMPGLTAWFGLTHVGCPRPGDTVVVSAAAGAVGQVVGQLAKLAGCRVIGIAGSRAKVAYVTEELGFDAGLDHRTDDLDGGLSELCPEGVDLYFDCVGGAVSEAVFAHIAPFARIVVCGQISQANLLSPEVGPKSHRFLLVNEARMEGFLLRQFGDRLDWGRARLGRLVRDGRLQYREDVAEGLDRAPEAFIGMLEGRNFGKQLVKLADA